MIEQAARILIEANASQMQLNIRVDGDKVTVIANTILNPTAKDESAEALKLRAALTQPIVITGEIGEVDVSITDALIQYTDTYVKGAIAHSNLLDIKVKTEKATKLVSQSKEATVETEKVSIESVHKIAESNQVLPMTNDFLLNEPDSL